MQERESWTTRFAFILATLGFSVGIGNLWRFPYLVGKYGGGIFLLFYVLVVLVMTIPLFTVEITLGKATRQDPVGAYKALAPGTPWFLNGYLNVLTLILVVGYAIPIVGTILAYVFKFAAGTFTGMSSQEIATYYTDFSANGIEVIAWTFLSIGILVFILRRGLKKGIELANNVMMPALLVILVILIIRAVTLPNVSQGLTFYLRPDIHKFSWEGALAAIGQTFFAVGVAMATALVYGSYLPRESKKLISNSTIIVLASSLIAFMAGLIIIPSVYAFGLDPAAGPGLTFITMPNVFNQMPAGRLFGTLFYVLFFLAALTSFIGAFEGIIAWIRDQLGIPRRKGVLVVGAGILILSSLSAASVKIFNLADYVVNNVFLILGALFMTLFVGWVWRIPNFARAVGITSKTALFIWSILIKYLIPLVIFVAWMNELGINLEISGLFQ